MSNTAFLRLASVLDTGTFLGATSALYAPEAPWWESLQVLQYAAPRPTPAFLECRHCGNPDVHAAQPCRYCQVTAGPVKPRKARSPERCPKCGKRVNRLVRWRDMGAGCSVFVVYCHGEHREAVLTDEEMEDCIETDVGRQLVANRIAEAIDRFAKNEAP